MKQKNWGFLALIFSFLATVSACSVAAKMQGNSVSAKEEKDSPHKIPSIELPEGGGVETESEGESTIKVGDQKKLPAAAPKVILLRGQVRDALNAEGIPGALVSITNVKGEAAIKPLTSTPDGSFIMPDLPPGTYKVKATAEGYIDADQEFTVVANEAKTIDLLLSGVLSESTFRAVLSWGKAPLDLDAHMKVIDVVSGLVVSDIYYDNYMFQDANVKASLDIDNVDGLGPETITFTMPTLGKYKLQFFVNNYMGFDGAKGDINVRLFKGRAMLGSYTLPAGSPGLTGFWNWSAFEIDPQGQVVPVKTFLAPFAYDYDPIVGTRRR